MPDVKIVPFQKTRLLESEIDEFLDKVSEAGMVFEQAASYYMDHGVDDFVEQKLEQITELESRGNELRRSIELVLYSEMLLPDARGDVLSLLDELDNVLDELGRNLRFLTIERPRIPEESRDEFKQLISEMAKGLEAMVRGSRAYFREPNAVRDHIHKISFHRFEASKIGLRLGRHIFDSDMPLERKLHLRNTLVSIVDLANHAEDAGDRLAIYAVKRSL